MELLLAARAQPETTSRDGETALALGARARRWGSVRRLAELRACLDAACAGGGVALTHAAEDGEAAMVDFLLLQEHWYYDI